MKDSSLSNLIISSTSHSMEIQESPGLEVCVRAVIDS